MQQRQVAPQRGHHANARVGIGEAGVDVHAADDEAPYGLLKRHGKPLVALAGRGHLLPPCGERVRGGRQNRGAVRGRGVAYDPPRLAQRLAQLGHRRAHVRVGLDLGAEELADHPVRPARALAHLEDVAVGIGEYVARLRIDEEELLFDTERDIDIRVDHGLCLVPPACSVAAVALAACQLPTTAIPQGRSPAGTVATTAIDSVSTTLTSCEGPFAVYR